MNIRVLMPNMVISVFEICVQKGGGMKILVGGLSKMVTSSV